MSTCSKDYYWIVYNAENYDNVLDPKKMQIRKEKVNEIICWKCNQKQQI